MIAVTGATGQLGRLTINEFLSRIPADQLIAAVRTPEKAKDLSEQGVQVREADYTRPETLETAFAGVDRLLLISSSEVGQRAAQHGNVIDTAKKAGVKLIAYTSILHADTTPLGLGEEHRQTETFLAASGLPYAVLRNGWYTENYAGSLAAAVENGIIAGCAGSGRISSAARADYAAAAAAVLLSPDPSGRIFELAGDTFYTLDELAAVTSSLSGRPVRYQDMTEDEYANTLEGIGLPRGLARMLADSDTGASKGGLFDDSHTLSGLIGRPTTPLADVVKKALGL